MWVVSGTMKRIKMESNHYAIHNSLKMKTMLKKTFMLVIFMIFPLQLSYSLMTYIVQKAQLNFPFG